MKLRKVLALLLVLAMSFALVACGDSKKDDKSDGTDAKVEESSDEGEDTDDKDDSDDSEDSVGDLSGKLVVWTLAVDLEDFSEKFKEENPGVELETVVIAPADYPTKVQSALLGGAKEPDVIVGEPQMLPEMFEAGFFEDLDQEPYNAQQYADQVVDYVWEVGQDADGVQRAISYQITPAGIFYRRDIANEVFGTEDPNEIGKLFKDYPTILETGNTLRDSGYRIFASDGEMGNFSGDTPWVIDGKLNVDQARHDFMDLSIALYQNDLTAFAGQWSAPWYQAMSGEVPVLTADTNIWDEEEVASAAENAEMTEVFAFGLPSWGVLTMRDNYGDTAGKWGVCSGPAYGFGGGTYIGISSNSERKDLAWEFVKFCTLDEETLKWWIEYSEGDVVSSVSVLDEYKDYENPMYGDQKTYSFWLEQAKGIDYSKVTKYDTVIGDAWGAAITAVKTEEMSKEDAINEFYEIVESTYPELAIER